MSKHPERKALVQRRIIALARRTLHPRLGTGTLSLAGPSTLEKWLLRGDKAY